MVACLLAAFFLLQQLDTLELRGTTVYGESRKQELMHTSLGSTEVGRNYIENNYSGTLMQSLGAIPGVQSSSIGAGQSKPAIRGLGFNRIAVTVDGIKHEGQQWGDDHGLEIDPFSLDRVEIIKGPGALLYGSDAIGGVLGLYTNYLPVVPFSGRIQFFGRSNNRSAGLSARGEGRRQAFYYKFHLTGLSYADYRVPAESISYYSYDIPLADGRMRNTAGREGDASLTLGYVGKDFRDDFKVSLTASESGFFADAHGLEVRLSNIDYDRSDRDIDLPRQSVSHLTVHNHSHFHKGNLVYETDLAWQHNVREERSEPVSHGYMPLPPDDLERSFDKHTLTGKAGLTILLSERNRLRTGADLEWQHNRRGGWGFILPDFETLSGGVYLTDRFSVSDDFVLHGGFRYDHIKTGIHPYTDWFLTPGPDGIPVFKERSVARVRRFDSLTGSLGVTRSIGHWVLKANIGKSFRVPIPKELGADGVNYHVFRYEQGNPDLSPEVSYQADAGINYVGKQLDIQIDPFINWFPNYIYLNPTSDYREGLQLYRYTQCPVLRAGAECQVLWKISPHWEASLSGEYLYARQMGGDKKGYTLPLMPPWTLRPGVKYLFGLGGYLSAEAVVAGDRRDIVPPEKPTDGYWLIHLSAGKDFRLGRTSLRAGMRIENLLDRRYYDHTSYYRLIGVPEPGRNVSLLLGLSF